MPLKQLISLYISSHAFVVPLKQLISLYISSHAFVVALKQLISTLHYYYIMQPSLKQRSKVLLLSLRRMDDLSFFYYSSIFCYLFIEFRCTFFLSWNIIPYIMFINIAFWLGSDWPLGLLSFVPALLFSIFGHLFLPSSSVSLTYFILAVPMRECLGKHFCMSTPSPI